MEDGLDSLGCLPENLVLTQRPYDQGDLLRAQGDQQVFLLDELAADRALEQLDEHADSEEVCLRWPVECVLEHFKLDPCLSEQRQQVRADESRV